MSLRDSPHIDDAANPTYSRDQLTRQEQVATNSMKTFSDITPDDLRQYPVWEFANDVEDVTSDESYLRPVRDLPITDPGNRIMGTIATLANGDQVPAILQNVNLDSPYATEHLISVTVFNRAGEAFPLARYHDIQIDEYGPEQLAAFMKLTVRDVFPISYDISDIAVGDHDCVRREIPVRPRRLLSSSEIIAMAVQGLR